MRDLSHCRVLIVDDTKNNIDVLVQGLSDLYKLNTAMDGKSAIESAMTDPPDLILLDIMMPGIDGYEVCRQLKDNEKTAHIPIIFVSALDEIQNKTIGFELGATDYIAKPFEIAEIRTKVRIHLELKVSTEEFERIIQEQARNLNDLTMIGKAMSTERDLSRVLELILRLARKITKADGGTLYLLTKDRRELAFNVMHNDTLNSYMGGTSEQAVTLPNIPLYIDDKPNHANVASFVALNAKTVNIPDVYVAEGFNFEGTKKFDKLMNYHCTSMLVVPMCDHEDEMIGVLQLINSQNATGENIPFSSDMIDLTEALASQAAVMLTQQNLVENLKDLFDAFIKAIATAIEEKSKYTGGHIERVTELTLELAKKINEVKEGPFADINFSNFEMEELTIAAWMHDTGKITTSQHVVDKAMKLEGVFDRIEQVKTRWQAISLSKQLEAEQRKLQITQNQEDPAKLKLVEEECQKELKVLAEDLAFLEEVNRGGEFMSDDKIAQLNEIAQKTYHIDGKPINYLTEDEVENLSIRKGTLTVNERLIIENHASMTQKILESLPWPNRLANVPDIASAHHEKLDGTGYPKGLKEEEICLQARIMAVSDVFEALSAPDRPYKKPMGLSQALKILGFMVKDKHLDEDVVNLMIDSGLAKEYATKYLSQEQIDA